MNFDLDMVKSVDVNVVFLAGEMDWLRRLIESRFEHYFSEMKADLLPVASDLALKQHGDVSDYEAFLLRHQFGFEERAAMALAMAGHVKPQVLDSFFTRNAAFDRRFTEFGGVVSGSDQPGFVPTGDTLLFLLAGDDLAARFALMRLFEPDHVFARESILRLAPPASPGDSRMSGRLLMSSEFIDRMCLGRERSAEFSHDFPARLVTTQLLWGDVVLNPSTLTHLNDIKDWLAFGDRLLHEYEMSARVRPGYTSLFYGPPGTGKTLTATLLGKEAGRDVYRIDLSMVVSKWIGETEKNLARVFDQAEGKRWILFFDEADSLFGKRTETQNSNDRYANQEVSYLLQRIEDFDGLAILASNRKENIDRAFTRRFQSIVNFPLPSADERLRLWQQAFPRKMTLEETIDLPAIAKRHEIAGGVIINVVRYCTIKALKHGEDVIRLADLTKGLEQELLKEGYFPS